jgi:hypothetical protein
MCPDIRCRGTSGAASNSHRPNQCLRVLQRITAFVTERKTRSHWLPARIVAAPAVSQVLSANAGETQSVGFWVCDVAAQ